MKKDAIIKIENTQTVDGEPELIQMTITGYVEHRDGESVIEYLEDNEEFGSEKVTVTITDGQCVSIVRHGNFSSEMSVQQNVRHHTYYQTPYGEFTMGIYGNRVSWFRNGAKSVLKIDYTLDFNNGYISQNSMKIFIEEK